MARYCATDGCLYAEHPLPRSGGSCPECGSGQYRMKTNVSTVACPACETPNEASDDTCWQCGEPLSHRILG